MFDDIPPEKNTAPPGPAANARPKLDLPPADPYFYKPGQLEEKLQSRGSLRKIIMIVVIIFVLAGVSFGGYFLYNKFFGQEKKEEAATNANLTINTNNINSSANKSNASNVNIGEFAQLGPLYWETICYLQQNPNAINYFSVGVMRQTMNAQIVNATAQACTSLSDDQIGAAFSDIRTDKDGDGVNLFFEKYYSTDDNLKDTDGDGYDDLTEVNGGYNPAGPGKL